MIAMTKGGLGLLKNAVDPFSPLGRKNWNSSHYNALACAAPASLRTIFVEIHPLCSWSESAVLWCENFSPGSNSVVTASRFRLFVRAGDLRCSGHALNPKSSLQPHKFGYSKDLRWQAQPTSAMASEMSGPPAGYRPNVGLCLVNDKNEVFVASRLDLPDSWQMPQGGVDDGEEPRTAAIRELKEETGVTSVQLLGEVQDWLTYDFPPDVKVKITRLWGRQWNGQAQKWFLFRFTGDDSEVDLLGDGKEPPEFGDWKWMPAEEVLKMAVEFKKPVYAQAFKSLAIYIGDSWANL